MKNITLEKTNKKLVNVNCGINVLIYDFVNLYDCTIGPETIIGAFCEIQKGVKIGKRCKISSHSFICEGVKIEDNVFIGHNVTFINDKFPRAVNKKNKVKGKKDWIMMTTLVKKGASIGSGSTILCGVTIGVNAIVGAGSVVTKDIAPNTVVCGNPARILRKIRQNE